MILLIIYSFVRALGIDLGVRATSQELSIQTVLAFLVVGGFAVAALLSDNPASWLKDVALVVIGFYFGSRTKGTDYESPNRGRQPRPSPTPFDAPLNEGGPVTENDRAQTSERAEFVARGPYLGRRKNPANLDSAEEFKRKYEYGAGGGKENNFAQYDRAARRGSGRSTPAND